ncbi:hypothetical protein B0H11DRAFT_2248025, partial [Mycena galericulata]
MPPKRKNALDSDEDYRAPGPSRPKRSRQAEEEMFFQTSSAPSSPNLPRARSLADSEDEEEMQNDVLGPLPDLMSKLAPSGEPPTSIAYSTPRRSRQRAVSESPIPIPSPATSTIFEPSPIKRQGGRRRTVKPVRHSRVFYSSMPSEKIEDLKSSARASTKAKAAERRKEKAAVAAESRRKEAEEAAVKAAEEEESRRKEAKASAAADLAKKRARAQEFLEKLTVPEAEGGAGFDSPMEWIELL